jgi:hypothetical protein
MVASGDDGIDTEDASSGGGRGDSATGCASGMSADRTDFAFAFAFRIKVDMVSAGGS